MNIDVQGSDEGIAVLSLDVALVLVGHLVAPGVPGGDVLAIGARQELIVLQLQAILTRAVTPRKAQGMAGQGTARVVALGAGLEEHHVLQIVIPDDLAHPLGRLFVHVPCQGAVEVFGIGGLPEDVVVGHVQNPRQLGGDQHVVLKLLLR